VVAVAASGRETIYEGAFGKRDLAKDDPMTLDSVFWIASMTKAITAAAAMQLVERGKLQLDRPLGELLPELASPQVLEGFDETGAPRLRSAHQPITLRRLPCRHPRHHQLPEQGPVGAARKRARQPMGVRHQH
jgi:methyl acetate hydrolase